MEDNVRNAEVNSKIVSIARQVAHDIRSPLSALNVAVQNLEKSPNIAKDLIEKTVTRIQAIADDLLNNNRRIKEESISSKFVARIDGEQVLDVAKICSEMVQEKKFELSNVHDLNIKLVAQQNVLASQSVGGAELRRILSNLINNSVEACDGSGSVEVHVKRAGRLCNIVISDSGRGIPSDVLPKVGTEGFSYGKANGNGLGLYHAKSMVESWGGRMKIHSKVNVGTTISIDLPGA